jgi:Kef-type K+ transport system membrane component KefB
VAVAELSITFFLQMAVILATCRVVGWLGRRYLKQPQVVCEMIAGVLLGPSLFGLVAPDIQRFVFRPENQGVLYVGAQFGVGLYMFLVGLGFRTDQFKANVHRAASVSIAGMVVPFAVALVATPWLMTVPGLFASTATRFDATLFMGAAIAITAFPMLARIIHERGGSAPRHSGPCRCPQAPSTMRRPGAFSPWCSRALAPRAAASRTRPSSAESCSPHS